MQTCPNIFIGDYSIESNAGEILEVGHGHLEYEFVYRHKSLSIQD